MNDYIPLDALLDYCREADERGGMVSTTEVRLFATMKRVTAGDVAFTEWANQEPTPHITDVQALEASREAHAVRQPRT
jgi:hypothetical protein